MNAEKFTQKTIETIQTAQNMAQENGNQYITPEHLLYALIDQDGGLIGTLFTRMGVDCDTVLAELDTVISNLPRVSGAGSEVYAGLVLVSPEPDRILSRDVPAAEDIDKFLLIHDHPEPFREPWTVGSYTRPSGYDDRIFRIGVINEHLQEFLRVAYLNHNICQLLFFSHNFKLILSVFLTDWACTVF